MPELTRWLMQELVQLPYLHQLVQVILQSPAFLCCMPFVLMIMTIEALVPFEHIPTHLIRSLEVNLVFYLLQYLINWLFEQRIDYLSP